MTATRPPAPSEAPPTAAEAPLPAAEPAASELIRRCAGEPGQTSPQEVAALAARVQDWPGAIALAGRHRVAAYLRDAVQRAEQALRAQILPTPAADALRVVVVAQTLTVGGLQGALTRTLGVLAGEDIPAVVLKGPVLARTLYPSPKLRPYSDVDLTVRPERLAAAAAALRAAGYREIVYDAEAAREAHEAHAGHFHESAGFHLMFVEPRSGGLVELHGDPLQLGLLPVEEEGRWRRAVPVPGLPGALMLGWEDQVVQLSVHAHKHGFERLMWLKDLDLLLRAHGDRLDWRLVERVARAEGVSASVWYALELTAALLGTPLPTTPDWRRLRPALPLRVAYRLTWPAARISDLGGSMRRRAVQFHAAESWRGMLPSLLFMGRRGDRARAVRHCLAGHADHEAHSSGRPASPSAA